MPYNCAADSSHTKIFVADFLQTKCDFRRKSAVLRFEPGAAYNDYLIYRLIRKRVVDFLLVLIELYSPGVTAEAIRVNIGSKLTISLQPGPVDQNFRYKGSPPPTILFFFSENYRLNDLSYGIKISTDLSSVLDVLSQSTRLTDRRTDRLAFSSVYRVYIPCSAIKTST